MSETTRFGEPIELPWWVFAVALPPALLVVFGLAAGPLWARGLAVVSSVATVALTVRIARRVESRSMQSVWVSLLLAVWFFCAVTWVAALMSR